MTNFNDAFEEIIGLEGGYVNDPDDPGGETKWGISKRAYPNLNIASLTIEDAKEIYWKDYWNWLGLAVLNDQEMAVELFEQGINFGNRISVQHVQYGINLLGGEVVVDGFIGPQTLKAINDLCTPEMKILHKIMNGLQFKRYLEIIEARPVQKKYFVGWLKRVDAYGDGA